LFLKQHLSDASPMRLSVMPFRTSTLTIASSRAVAPGAMPVTVETAASIVPALVSVWIRRGPATTNPAAIAL
jgi:hypothetical protein